MENLKYILFKIYNLGVLESQDFNQKSKIRWFNLVSFSTFLAFFNFTIVFYLLGFEKATYICAITSFFNILSYILNYKNQFILGTILMSTANIISSVLLAVLYGRKSGSIMVQILWIMSSQYLFDNKKLKMILFIFASMVMVATEWMIINYPPLYDLNGFMIYFSILSVSILYLYLWINSYLRTNLEYRKQLSEKNEQLSTLINNIPALIYFKDVKLRYLSINNLFAEKLNLDYESVIGKSDEELGHPEFNFFKKLDLEVISLGKPIYNIVTKYHDNNNQFLWYSTSKVPYFDKKGNIAGIIGIVQDITNYKNSEDKLKELNATKDKFFSIIAHDLEILFQL